MTVVTTHHSLRFVWFVCVWVKKRLVVCLRIYFSLYNRHSQATKKLLSLPPFVLDKHTKHTNSHYSRQNKGENVLKIRNKTDTVLRFDRKKNPLFSLTTEGGIRNQSHPSPKGQNRSVEQAMPDFGHFNTFCQLSTAERRIRKRRVHCTSSKMPSNNICQKVSEWEEISSITGQCQLTERYKVHVYDDEGWVRAGLHPRCWLANLWYFIYYTQYK